MIRFAKIPDINGIVFSDPSYDGSYQCQYRKEFHDTEWVMKMNTKIDSGTIFFTAAIGRPTVVSSVRLNEDALTVSVSCPGRYLVHKIELGCDTARMFCGNAKNWNEAGEEASIHTGADGFFGDLMVFTCKGEKGPAGFLLLGTIDEMMIDEENLFRHFTSSFDGQEIPQKVFHHLTDSNNIEFMVAASKENRHAKEFDASINKENPDFSRD